MNDSKFMATLFIFITILFARASSQVAVKDVTSYDGTFHLDPEWGSESLHPQEQKERLGHEDMRDETMISVLRAHRKSCSKFRCTRGRKCCNGYSCERNGICRRDCAAKQSCRRTGAKACCLGYFCNDYLMCEKVNGSNCIEEGYVYCGHALRCCYGKACGYNGYCRPLK